LVKGNLRASLNRGELVRKNSKILEIKNVLLAIRKKYKIKLRDKGKEKFLYLKKNKNKPMRVKKKKM